MSEDLDRKPLRDFGLLVGSVLAAIAFWPMVMRGESLRMWPLATGALLLILALTRPRLLRPLYRIWMRIGEWLGWLNTRIILAIGFFGLVTPIGLVMRLVGKDPMRRRIGEPETSYRLHRTPRSGAHMFHQY
ncbi:MAG: hypothetical protein E8D45_01010 [Nitrospira sp.]|nr:MAG: hypothetical protein E8D45_01010 [Nitrospira sp.]